ncbi:MAG: tRNA-intron lyase [Promethearchaeota archaeon]
MNEASIVAEAKLVGDKGIVWNAEHGMKLYEEGYFGQPVGIRKPKVPVFDKPLTLSLIECAYLTQQKRLNVRRHDDDTVLSVEDILQVGSEISDDFRVRYTVYSQLRNRGFVVRLGLKFGTEFAVYEIGPGKDHSPFLVHVIHRKEGVIPLDIVRAGRLALSVNKEFIIATVKENDEIVYYSFIWYRP